MTLSRLALALIAGLILLLGLQTWRLDGRSAERDAARAAAERAEARHILFAERVRAKAEEISRKALERARRVEAEQDRISQETAHEYESQLAALRARYDRLLRERAGGADPGRAGDAAGLPPLPQPARGPDGAAEPDRLPLAGDPRLPLGARPELALGERLLCSEQSLRLLFLQRWVRGQQGVER